MRTLAPLQDTSEQLVVLKCPDSRLKLATSKNYSCKLGYFSPTNCS